MGEGLDEEINDPAPEPCESDSDDESAPGPKARVVLGCLGTAPPNMSCNFCIMCFPDWLPASGSKGLATGRVAAACFGPGSPEKCPAQSNAYREWVKVNGRALALCFEEHTSPMTRYADYEECAQASQSEPICHPACSFLPSGKVRQQLAN
eukprot:s1937_g3.t1